MNKFITLKQIIEEADAEDVTRRTTRPFPEGRDEDDEGGEDDGLPPEVTELPAPNVQYANAGNRNPTAPFQAWKHNTMQVDAIRNFYPRKGGKPGCRVLMKTGAAYIVVETHDEILALINA